MLLNQLFKRSQVTEAGDCGWQFLGGLTNHRYPTQAGEVVDEGIALTYSAWYAAVKRLSSPIASFPFPVYERTGKNSREKNRDHPVYPLIHDRPNQNMTSFDWRRVQQSHAVNWGNGFSFIMRRGDPILGEPVSIWPLSPTAVCPKYDSNGELFYEVKGSDNTISPLHPLQVIHIAGMGFDGVRGYSIISLAKNSIGLGLATEKHGSQLFRNGAVPAGILSQPGKLNPKAKENIVEQWKKRHGGNNSLSTAILDDGMTFTQIGMSSEDSQFLETRKMQVTEISRWTGVPPHLLGDLERATFTNIAEQAAEFVRFTLMEWIVNWQMEINAKLFNPADDGKFFAEFNLDALLRGDLASRSAANATALQNGWKTRNEVRAEENMNPLEDGGDMATVQLSMVNIADVADGSIDSGGSSQGTGQSESTPSDTDEENSAATVAEERRLVTESRSMAQRRRATRSHHKLFKDAGSRLVTKEVKAVRAAVKKFLLNGQVAAFEKWMTKFYAGFESDVSRTMKPSVASMGETIGAIVADERGADDVPDGMDAFVDQYVAAYTSRHVLSSQGQLNKMLEEHEGNEAIRAIDKKVDTWEANRADNIGRRESAQSAAAFAVLAYGLFKVDKLRWRNIGSATCPMCTELDGKVVSTGKRFAQKGQKFENEAGEKMTAIHDFAHPPLHDGCDCMVVAE